MTPERPTFDFLIIADRAEVINGRLHMMGGGWEVLDVNPPQPTSFSLAVGVLVPWLETNRDHTPVIRLENADGQEVLSIQIALRMGRPAELEEGSAQRFMATITMGLMFPAPGRYVFVATLGTEQKRLAFTVRSSGGPMLMPTPPAGIAE